MIPCLSCQATRFLHVEIARAGGGTEQTFPEARAFFIGPIDQAHRHRRLPSEFRTDAPQDFQAGESVERTIEPAAVRHRVDVTADE